MNELDLDAHSINLKCPKCSKIIPETIGKLKSDPTLICTSCGSDFNVQVDELQKGIERVEVSIENLRKAIKKYSKR